MSNDFNLEDFNLEDYNFMTADILNNKRVNNKRVNNKNMTVSVVINNSAIAAYVEGINTIFECINNNIDIDIDIDISTLRESIKKDIADNVVNYININIE